MSDPGFWFIQGPGWLLVLYLAVAQCTAAVSYEFGVRLGTQEPAEKVTEVGVAFWKGFAVADLLYTPLLAAGLIGHMLGAAWTPVVLGAALGITLYWPLVCLWAIKSARGKRGWTLPKETQYWVVLPIIEIWGAVSLVILLAS